MTINAILFMQKLSFYTTQNPPLSQKSQLNKLTFSIIPKPKKYPEHYCFNGNGVVQYTLDIYG